MERGSHLFYVSSCWCSPVDCQRVALDRKVILNETEMVLFRRQMFWDWNKQESLEFGDYDVLFLQHHQGTQALPVLSYCLHLLSHLSRSLAPLSFYSNIVSLGRGRRGHGTGAIFLFAVCTACHSTVSKIVLVVMQIIVTTTETTLSEQPVS